ncbi:MAG: 30S ribosome-binding factor RbfA [Myxococcota bacterium]|jgi:ribosome-binding factor A|nr:30S ribosome-binding factor RbfA [Myxococcota bacterium]
MNRPSRVAVQVQNCLATILREDVHQGEIPPVSITRVWLSKDLKLARVYFLPLGGDGSMTDILDRLGAHSGFLRKRLARRLQLRNTPQLRFFMDEDLEEAVRITNLLDSLGEAGQESEE